MCEWFINSNWNLWILEQKKSNIILIEFKKLDLEYNYNIVSINYNKKNIEMIINPN